jgi:long-subunit fatty acid transport protein
MKTPRLKMIFILSFLSSPLFAFDEFPVGARPAGMGEAFTAVADDVHSLYYNPAGLASLYRPEVTAYYARPFPSLSDQTKTAQTFINITIPIPKNNHWGGLGVEYQEFRVDSLFKERTVTLAYGRSLFSDRLALGLGLKELSRIFGHKDILCTFPVSSAAPMGMVNT